MINLNYEKIHYERLKQNKSKINFYFYLLKNLKILIKNYIYIQFFMVFFNLWLEFFCAF